MELRILACLQQYVILLLSHAYGGPKVSRQFQFAHGNFNLLTAVSICSRQFQFAHGSFNFAHGNFNLLTAVSISLMMKLQWISANAGHAG